MKKNSMKPKSNNSVKRRRDILYESEESESDTDDQNKVFSVTRKSSKLHESVKSLYSKGNQKENIPPVQNKKVPDKSSSNQSDNVLSKIDVTPSEMSTDEMAINKSSINVLKSEVKDKVKVINKSLENNITCYDVQNIMKAEYNLSMLHTQDVLGDTKFDREHSRVTARENHDAILASIKVLQTEKLFEMDEASKRRNREFDVEKFKLESKRLRLQSEIDDLSKRRKYERHEQRSREKERDAQEKLETTKMQKRELELETLKLQMLADNAKREQLESTNAIRREMDQMKQAYEQQLAKSIYDMQLMKRNIDIMESDPKNSWSGMCVIQ
jgi:hypothetical protein